MLAILTRQGWIEVARRASAEVALVAAAAVGFGYSDWLVATLLLAFGAAIYVLPSRPVPPAGAYFAQRMPSVYMPDLLAALLATTFFALPFVVAAHDPLIDAPWSLLLMTGLPGAISLAIFWIAASYQCHWVWPSADHLVVASIRGEHDLPFADITMVRGAVKLPPRWLAPLLGLFGGVRGAGTALLHGHRARHYLVVERHAGPPLRLPVDALTGLPDLLAKLARAGVPLADDLRAGISKRR